MAEPLPVDATVDRGHTLASAALALGAASIALFAVGFVESGFVFALSLLLALSSLICGIFAVGRSRRRRTRMIAVVGGVLGLVPWLFAALVALAFAFSPGD